MVKIKLKNDTSRLHIFGTMYEEGREYTLTDSAIKKYMESGYFVLVNPTEAVKTEMLTALTEDTAPIADVATDAVLLTGRRRRVSRVV